MNNSLGGCGWALCFVASIILLVGSGRVGGVTIGFEPGDLAQFNINGTNGSGYTINPTAGVGGSGGLVVAAGTNATALYGTPFLPTLNVPIKVSLDYKWQSNPAAVDAYVGFATDPALTDFDLSSPTTVFGVAHNATPGGPSPTPAIDLQLHNNSGFAVSPPVTATVGDWYRLEIQMIEKTGPSVDETVNRYALGPNGTSAPVLVDTLHLVHSTSNFTIGTPVYAGFKVFINDPAYDNFTVVPEPGSAVITTWMFVTSLTFARRWRSRR